ncbi:MAG: YeeE/YedE thiosulfate transporter family protein [Acidocella sp.]|nr:YeeE/YedE thiosulfate transporter family protein [Acidocella sp.]
MIAPLDLAGPVSGVALGIGFGFVLENAGFGNPEILTGQLRFTNWSVFQTMFTAIIVSSILLNVAAFFGVVSFSNIFIPSVLFWGTLLGGMCVGIGFAVGGYCPGTSIVGFMSGRVDAIVFLIGIGAGTLVFNMIYPIIGSWIYTQAGPDALTVPQLLHIPAWAVIALLAAVLLGVGYLVSKGKLTASCAAPRAGVGMPRGAAMPNKH